MSRVFIAFCAGVIFAVGLIVAQMTNPAKVIGFLNVAGQWDPSLALVMAGAIPVFGVAYWRSQRRASPVFAPAFVAPRQREVTRDLVVGSLLFGAGWGLSGFCPGPAIVAVGFGEPQVWVFVAAMLTGMVLFRFRSQPRKGPATQA